MKHGSLFSGIGGFDLAAEWMGWENVFHCEWNEFGQKVLKHYWPKAISYEDITNTDFTIHRGNIDILTGGFPCQPYSSAGKRLGKEDERHLWPQMLRAIREIKPRWVVGENVYGLVNWSGGLVFHEVQADLEAEGYEVQPYLLPAVSVNAPHRRDRIWFVAYSKSARTRSNIGWIRSVPERCDKWKEDDASSTHANNTRTNIGMPSEREWTESDGIGGLAQPELGQTGRDGDAADTDFVSNNHKPNSRGNEEIIESRRQEDKRVFTGVINGRYSKDDDYADTNNEVLESGDGQGETGGRADKKVRIKPFDKPGDWSAFPSVSPICTGDDGFSDRLDGITFPKWRNESIKAGGNAVCPPLVYQIFKTIEEYEIINNVHNPTH